LKFFLSQINTFWDFLIFVHIRKLDLLPNNIQESVRTRLYLLKLFIIHLKFSIVFQFSFLWAELSNYQHLDSHKLTMAVQIKNLWVYKMSISDIFLLRFISNKRLFARLRPRCSAEVRHFWHTPKHAKLMFLWQDKPFHIFFYNFIKNALFVSTKIDRL